MEDGDKEMLEFIITALLADYDLFKLIEEYQRPFEEYAPEARSILKYLEKVNYDVRLDTLAEQIQYIFLYWFDILPHIKPCVKIAYEIKKVI